MCGVGADFVLFNFDDVIFSCELDYIAVCFGVDSSIFADFADFCF